MLIAEEFLTLMCDTDFGYDVTRASSAVRGALVAEAALNGAFTIDKHGQKARSLKGTITCAADHAPTSPLLAEVYEASKQVPTDPMNLPANVIRAKLPEDVSQRVVDGMVASGVLALHERKRFGMFKYTIWNTSNPATASPLRARLTDVLVTDTEPDARTAILGAFLSAWGAASRVVDRGGVSRREVWKRARALSEADWAPPGTQTTMKECLAHIRPSSSGNPDTNAYTS